ncbi:MAG: glucose-1-phosphate adenylyltransferase [Candidatus Aminicenantales bacterium]
MAARVATIIMAGGQGTRLYPLTKIRSKPAVPIAGRFRLIDVPISNCIHSDYRKIFLLTQFASESLHRHIFSTYRFDNFHKDFIAILAAKQTIDNRGWFQGTADAVRQNLTSIEGSGDLALILSGDHLYRMDYRKFVEAHERAGADISISVVPVSRDAVPGLGVMKVDASKRIVEFKEKPTDNETIEAMAVPPEIFTANGIEPRGRTHVASMGIYIFNWKVMKELLENTTDEDFGRQIIPRAIQEKKVYAHFFDGYWADIGTIASFFEANIGLTQPLPLFNFYDEEKPVFSIPRFLPGSKILDADVHDSILCEGSIINQAYIRHSIIGVRSRIGEGTRLDRTVMMGADYYESIAELREGAKNGIPPVGVGRNCEIRNAIIDKNARIGDGVKLVNVENLANRECDDVCIVDGIIVVPKNSVISPGTVI